MGGLYCGDFFADTVVIHIIHGADDHDVRAGRARCLDAMLVVFQYQALMRLQV